MNSLFKFVVTGVILVSCSFANARHLKKKSSHSKHQVSSGANYRGQTCRSSDTDPIKCTVCALAWEANNSSYKDMQGIVGVIKTRQRSSSYSGSICKLVYQRGQIVGLRSGKRLNLPPGVLSMMVRAARSTGASGNLGWRTGRNGLNKFRKKAELIDPLLKPSADMFAALATERSRSSAMTEIDRALGQTLGQSGSTAEFTQTAELIPVQGSGASR